MLSFLKKNKKKAEKLGELKAYADGKVIPIEEVDDGVFSAKMLGDGLAIRPENEILYAPCDGEVSVLMEDSGHACGLHLSNDVELLLHIGLNTVSMNHDGFEVKVKVGDKVKAGQELIHFDRSKIKAAGFDDVIIMVISDEGDAENVNLITGMSAVAKETTIVTFD